MSRLDRQLEIEQEANDFSYKRLKEQVTKRIEYGQADELTEGRTILLHALDKVTEKIKEYFELKITGKMKASRDLVALDYYTAPQDLAYTILVTIVRSVGKDVTIPVTTMIRNLNTAIYNSISIKRLHEGNTNFGVFIDKRYKNRSEKFRTEEKLKTAKKQKLMSDMELTPLTAYLGATLIDLVIKSGVNIIEKKIIVSRGKRITHLVYTEECYKMILQSRDRLLAEYRKFPIFVAKPVDWTEYDGSGGYHSKDLYQLPMIKTRSTSKKLIREFFKKTDTTMLSDVLNALQATKWRVNRRVFDVMDTIFSSNMKDPESSHNNPYLIGRLPYNGLLQAEDFVNVADYGELCIGKYGQYFPVDKKQQGRYLQALENQRDITISSNGKAIMMNLVMYNAREYLEEDEIYFSYQYDFRGRIYPIQQHLQPQGKSEVKALLEFAEGVPIENEEQLEWFLIHGANCYGYDKLEYSERVCKARELTNDILAIADDPLGKRNLWKDADSPYLFLAWCFEYADYLRDPVNFRSHLPISLDATCSGIQIYSGLLRDAEGAEAVNVIGNTRQDIYQRVADKVNSYLLSGDYPKEIEYTTGDGEGKVAETTALADSIKGKVTRGLTKRNTMTQPYSVTKFGMYEQLKAELIELEQNNKRFWVGETWLAAKLLTDLNDRAIAEVVKGARVGQNYLKKVTQEVVSNGSWVFFTTPITNFPVLQKIHQTEVERVVTPVGKLVIRNTIEDLNAKKMVNGIAPNFIHSLDASLLASTVLKLKEDGCSSFHLIHDSYGVPINQVTNLNKRVREAFVELFEQHPLQRFINQVHPTIEEKVEDVMIDTLDLKQVLESKYIFS